MTMLSCTRALAFTFVAPAAAWLPVVMPAQATGLSSSEASALQAAFDPSLGSLRAGRVATPAPFGTQEREALAVAQQQSSALGALRAGAPTDTEWGWIAIGAAVVLLIILL